MEPLNTGHIGTFQLPLERLSSSRRSIYTQNVQLVHFCLSIIGGCPYLGVSFIGGSTVALPCGLITLAEMSVPALLCSVSLVSTAVSVSNFEELMMVLAHP